jgi:hypothetical protein
MRIMMMNTVVGSAIGGFVAGAVALGAASAMKPSRALAFSEANSPYATTLTDMRPARMDVNSQQPVYRDAIVTRPVARASTVSQSSSTRTSTVRREQSRSWAKTAMIIGGSAGGGAGIGGLIGGKKGALIGAAVGGGAASIYEARKR